MNHAFLTILFHKIDEEKSVLEKDLLGKTSTITGWDAYVKAVSKYRAYSNTEELVKDAWTEYLKN